MGYITRKQVKENQEIFINVNWVSTQEVGEVTKEIFDENVDLQRLTAWDLQRIERQFGDKLQKVYDLLPPPNEERDFYEKISESNSPLTEQIRYEDLKEDKGGVITVFYGTNRNTINNKNGVQRYGDKETDVIKYGICDVQLPEGHREGELERPGKFINLFPFPENEHIHVTLKSSTELEERTFVTKFVERLGKEPSKHALGCPPNAK